MKIKLDTTIKPAKEVKGLVLGKALRLGPDKSGALVLTPEGEFVVVNKKGIRAQDKNETLIALIIAARKSIGLSQTDLAIKTGFTRSTVASWEIGRSFPSLFNVMAILWVCGIVDKWEGLRLE